MKSENSTVEGAIIIATLPFFLASLILGPITRGWALCKMWAWFVVPIFGLAPLHIVPAIGLMVVAAFIINHPIRPTPKDEKSAAEKMLVFTIGIILNPLASLGVAWIVMKFM